MNAPSGWDALAVGSPGGHVLQSTAWARIREAQGWQAEYVRIGDPLPVALVLWRRTPLGTLGYAPRGPVVADGDALRRSLGALARLARERRAIFLKVDPEMAPEVALPAYAEAGYRRAPDVQPVLATLELDLGRSEEELLAGLEKDTRWSVRTGAKRGVAVRVASGEDDLRRFYDLYGKTGERARFVTREWGYYGFVWRTLIDAGLATLRLAELEGRAVAAAMTWHCGERELYMYGATNDEARKALAAYPLQWECILAAKRRGAKRYDFGGAPAAEGDRRDPMYGPYLFKKGFGGTFRPFAGAFDTVPDELRYRSYRVAEPVYTRLLQLRRRS